MVNQDLFVVTLRVVTDNKSRPKSGWQIFRPAPGGDEPVLTARGNPKKFKNIEDALIWVRVNFAGYSVHLDMDPFFSGRLYPTFQRPELLIV